MMTGFHRLQTTFGTTPGHYCSVRCQTTVQNFIPTQQVTTMAVQETFHTMDKITLKFVYILQSFLLHTCLT